MALKLSVLNSIESETAPRKLLIFGRMITEIKLTPSVRRLLQYRADSLFDDSISSLDILSNVCEALRKYKLFEYFEVWFHNSTFPATSAYKNSCKNNKIKKSDENAYYSNFS